MSNNPKIELPVEVNVDDLTLAELDRASSLVNNEGIGRTTAIVFVALKRTMPGLKLPAVAALRSGDVTLVDDDDLAKRDTPRKDVGPDPTS